uniref:Uncharacterized protein n=1 Tax=Janibacter limosus TaxID=53458 RepID=A0AC61U7B2_9MICO|nr:hypothetical protein [Janibacter limosus]
MEGFVADPLPGESTVTAVARATDSPTFADRQRGGAPLLEPGHVLTEMRQAT